MPESMSGTPAPGLDDAPTTAEFDAFVGPNARFYRSQWVRTDDGSIRARGFNKGAFFLSGFWLGYRKMYRVAAIFFGVLLVETVLEDIVFLDVMGLSESPGPVGSLVGLVFALVAGYCGNRWYLAHATRAIAEARATVVTGDEHHAVLAKRGGTSVLASMATALAAVLLSGIVLIAIDLIRYPAGFDSTMSFHGNDTVSFAGGVDEADVRALAAALSEEGVFGHAGAAARLSGGPDGFVVSFILERDAWDDAEIIEYWRELGERLAAGRFSRPLTIELCDAHFRAQKTLHVE